MNKIQPQDGKKIEWINPEAARHILIKLNQGKHFSRFFAALSILRIEYKPAKHFSRFFAALPTLRIEYKPGANTYYISFI